MPKYLMEVSYAADGVKGLMKDGGSRRRAVADTLLQSLGGRIESFYYAFGETDVFVIADLPDNSSAAAASLALAGSGAVTNKVTVLLTPDEIDQAVKKGGTYTPPGR